MSWPYRCADGSTRPHAVTPASPQAFKRSRSTAARQYLAQVFVRGRKRHKSIGYKHLTTSEAFRPRVVPLALPELLHQKKKSVDTEGPFCSKWRSDRLLSPVRGGRLPLRGGAELSTLVVVVLVRYGLIETESSRGQALFANRTGLEEFVSSVGSCPAR